MSKDGSRSGGADQVAPYEVRISQSVTQVLFEQVLEVFLAGPLEDWPGRVADGLAYVCRQSPSGLKTLPEMAVRILEVAERGIPTTRAAREAQEERERRKGRGGAAPQHFKAPRQRLNQKHA